MSLFLDWHALLEKSDEAKVDLQKSLVPMKYMAKWQQVQVQVSSLLSSSLLRKIEKIQNMMYHCSQLAIAIRGEQWLDTK